MESVLSGTQVVEDTESVDPIRALIIPPDLDPNFQDYTDTDVIVIDIPEAG